MAKSATIPAARTASQGSTQSRSSASSVAIGLYMFAMAIALTMGLLLVWPSSVFEGGVVVWVGLTETSALMIAMLCGALGSYIHAATSFASYAGNRSLSSSWTWWFMLRPAIGAGLALMAYFIMRSGFLLDGPLGTDVSPFGIAAISAMIGLIAKQLVDKFKAISDAAFNTSQDAERIDKL